MCGAFLFVCSNPLRCIRILTTRPCEFFTRRSHPADFALRIHPRDKDTGPRPTPDVASTPTPPSLASRKRKPFDFARTTCMGCPLPDARMNRRNPPDMPLPSAMPSPDALTRAVPDPGVTARPPLLRCPQPNATMPSAHLHSAKQPRCALPPGRASEKCEMHGSFRTGATLCARVTHHLGVVELSAVGRSS